MLCWGKFWKEAIGTAITNNCSIMLVGEVLKRNYMLPVLPQQHNVGWEKLLEKRYTAITITNLTNNCRIDKVAAVIEEALEEQYTAKL